MHREMGEMIGKADALLDRLELKRLARHGDVAQNADYRVKGLNLGEAEHIGGAVLAAPLLVELTLFGVIGEHDSQFGRALDLGLGLLERSMDGALGQRINILRPGVVIADDGNLERRRGQRAASCIAFSVSRLAVSAS